MEAKNLRIGNYLQDGKGGICKVEKLGTDWNENGIEAPAIKGALTKMPNAPIGITEDWLLNFGFKCEVKEGNQNEFRVYKLDQITYNTNHGWWWKHQLDNQPKYIHELQNLFFAITGKELELKNESSACV